MFLRFLGIEHDQLYEECAVPVDYEGSSLLSLQKNVSKFNIESEIRRYNSEDIDHVPLPAIAHLYTSPTTLTGLHFGVFYDLDKEYVYMLDGTTGDKRRIHRGKLKDFWSGYALVNKAAFRDSGRYAIIMFLVGSILGVVLVRQTVRTLASTK